MEKDHGIYQEPLVGRYTEQDMQILFSDDFKFQTWRKCWTALAEAEMELGIKRITPQMIGELIAYQKTIDYEVAAREEGRRRHDVMAHVYEYGTHCPTAAGIIHLGATSMLVDDNTVLIQQREAMNLVKRGLVNVIHNMAGIAEETKGLACLAYTHLQPAQPTTMGKRFTLYIQDLLYDLDCVEAIKFKALGAKGTTGTQESFLKLFDGDREKAEALDKLFSKKLGFEEVWPVTGQTYPRKFDVKVAETLAGIGQSLYKFAGDMRILSHDKCVDEPFEKEQIGSSAMAYKRNPMRLERLNGLARKLMGLPANFYNTASSQYFERTLDDSAIRRMDIPQEFLLADAILILANNITDRNVDPDKGNPLTFYPQVIRRLLEDELQFLATEEILMDLVKQGNDRQQMHEIIRRHSVAASKAMKEEGLPNTLFKRLEDDPEFPMDKSLWKYIADASRFTGNAQNQTEEDLRKVVKLRLAQKRYSGLIGRLEGKVSV